MKSCVEKGRCRYKVGFSECAYIGNCDFQRPISKNNNLQSDDNYYASTTDDTYKIIPKIKFQTSNEVAP